MTDRLAAATDPLGNLRTISRRHPALAQLGAGLAMYEGARASYATVKDWYGRRCVYTVQVREHDRIYDAVMDWLMELLPSGNHRQLVASSSSGAAYDDTTPADPSTPPARKRLRVQYADNSDLNVDVDGHRIRVSLDIDDPGGSEPRRGTRPERRIELRCRSRAAQEAVLRHLQEIHERQTRTEPTLWMTGTWGEWQKRSDLPLRTLESVILPPEQKTAIVEDLQAFLDAEPRYNELAIPWHRGYMFHGPPGTGKTSLAKALATLFGMDLWYISLADLRETSDLMGLIRGVRPRSILLLEDIDTASLTHDRDTTDTSGQDGAVSMAALLNALDGVATPHGLVTIMTTNHLDKLDPALTRPGRMDRIELLDLPGPAEVEALFTRFYGRPLDLGSLPGDRQLSQAELSEIFKRHLDDPAGARADLAHALGSEPCGLAFGDGWTCDLAKGHA